MKARKRWIIVEDVRPAEGQVRPAAKRYPRSPAVETPEEAEALKTSYLPEHGGELLIIPISEFYTKKRPKDQRTE